MLGKMRAAPEQGRGNVMADQDFAEAEREAGTQTAAQSATLFETAAQLLRFNIEQGHLYPSLVLQESGLSERLNMSRATVKRALAILEAEGLISKFAGRGFIVSGGIGAPRRDDRPLGVWALADRHGADDILSRRFVDRDDVAALHTQRAEPIGDAVRAFRKPVFRLRRRSHAALAQRSERAGVVAPERALRRALAGAGRGAGARLRGRPPRGRRRRGWRRRG